MHNPAATTTTKRPPAQTCTDHCGRCGRHFHGVGAFDAHRRDGACADPLELAYGVDSQRSGRLILQPWTTSGRCSLAAGCYADGRLVRYEEPVTVWQIAQTAERTAALTALRAARS